MNCNVCGTPLGSPIYESSSDYSLTSLCELRPGTKKVWSCSNCGHLRSEALSNNEEYYKTDYRILLNEDDEDQIYEVHGENIIYRTEHQVITLLSKLQLTENTLLLDYGCAKASTPKQLLARRPDLQVHLFDVSEMYTAHWNRIISADRCAVHSTPPHWQQRFDVITSFFALEHMPHPAEVVRQVFALLKDDGIFYGIVPDTFGNLADFVVIDHVNHFTAPSLQTLLVIAGFSRVEIDSTSHRGGLVFTAYKKGAPTELHSVNKALSQAQNLSQYWSSVGRDIRAAELSHGDKLAAIYGSGFYGAYIASAMQRRELLICFLDRSPYQQGRMLFGKAILAPENIPDTIDVLYVGLNPAIAHSTIESMDWVHQRNLSTVFLSDESK